jgi:hypothetical protein
MTGAQYDSRALRWVQWHIRLGSTTHYIPLHYLCLNITPTVHIQVESLASLSKHDDDRSIPLLVSRIHHGGRVVFFSVWSDSATIVLDVIMSLKALAKCICFPCLPDLG